MQPNHPDYPMSSPKVAVNVMKANKRANTKTK